MSTKVDELSKEFDAGLAAIRFAVGKLSGARLPWDSESSFDLLEQGDRMVRFYENWLLDDEQEQVLSVHSADKFILYASSYLCDIALTDGQGLPPLAKDFIDDRARAFFYQSLTKRSCELIRDGWQDLGVPERALAGTITRVCLQAAGGNFTPAESEATLTDDATVNVTLLAACLQLCRMIDLKSPATILQIVSYMPKDNSLPPGKLKACFSVTHAGAHPSLTGTIRLRIQCTHPDVHRALKHHERSLQQLLEKLNQQVRPRFLYSDVLFEIEPDGYTPIDLKFTVDSSAGLQLFMGNRLYSDKRVFLRELIQNAVDACSYRKLGDPSYSPAIALEFNDDVSTIKIRDNGIGMTRQWIEKYFLAIGISFYQSNEIRSVNRDPRIDFSFISQFGIGFLSSFQVADKIVIKTRKAFSPGLMITINGLRDYFDVNVLEEDHPVGTEVTLHLRKSQTRYCRSVEYTGYLKTNIRFLKIPVELTEAGGNTSTIGFEQLAYDKNASAGTVFVAPLKFMESEGYVRLGAKRHGTNIFALESADGGVSVFQDGIFVTQFSSLLPEGARQYVVTRINLVGQDKCELSMDRNRIFWKADQLQNIKRVIRYGLVDVANQLMSAIKTQEVSVNTLNSIVNHLAIFFDFSDVDDVMYNQLAEPIRKVVEKRFRDFVRINFAHTHKKSGIAEADGYSEAWQQQVLENLVKK
jgi:Histidine kinase-, DNA gyrase B-, and HSP90-like ATPase